MGNKRKVQLFRQSKIKGLKTSGTEQCVDLIPTRAGKQRCLQVFDLSRSFCQLSFSVSSSICQGGIKDQFQLRKERLGYHCDCLSWTLSLKPTHPGSLRLWPPPSYAMSRSLEMSQSHKNLSPTTSLTSEWTRNTSGGQEILTSSIYDCLDWTVNIATSWTTKQFIFMSSQPWIKVFRTADDPILYIGIISIGLGISSRVSCLWSSLFFSMSISFAGLGEFFRCDSISL